jgi:hypothetical protein
MKIAVLIAGEYREFAIAHKFWTFLGWPDVDCYFSTWTQSCRVTDDVHMPYTCEIITTENIRSLINVIDLEITELVVEELGNHFTTWKMISRWKSAINLLRKSKIQYDRVILIRPDIALAYDEKLFKEFIYQSFNDNDLYGITNSDLNVPFPLKDRGQMSDLMLLGTQNSVMKLLDLPTDGFFKIQDTKRIPILIDVHAYLAEHCSKLYSRFMNMPIADQCIVRTNCRTLTDPTFYDCKLKAKEWWEKKHKKFYWMGGNIWDYKLYHDTHPESRRQRTFNTDNINLWGKIDLSCHWDSPRGSQSWHAPDTEEIFLRNSADKHNQHKITYGKTDITYDYNSFGFRTDSGPKEFEDIGTNPVFMVGGCSITEGIGLPEHRIWHSFLYNRLADHCNRPMVKLNMGKGGISIATTIRYIYTMIEHYNVHPDLLYIVLPPVSRQELIVDNHNDYVHHYIPGLPPPLNASRLLNNAINVLNKNINYRQLYHNCYRDLLFLKWFLLAKNIPWFFSSWSNDFAEETIKQLIPAASGADYTIPSELLINYIPAKILYNEYIKPDNIKFPQTIARDYVHYGPNSHLDLADQIYDKLSKHNNFRHILEKWRKDD